MRARKATLLAVVAAAVLVAVAIAFGGSSDSKADASAEATPGQPSISIISPRNGARQTSHAAVVKVAIENFKLAPALFGADPQLGEGHIRYSLNRVPDCVDPVKLLHAINSPLGNGRLVGRSMDYPEFAGPNGILAERIGTAGGYSPGTRPEIYYHDLPPGLYRVVVNLAQNNGSTTPYHDVTNFQILPKPGHGPKPCPPGKVASASAAAHLR